MTNSNSRVLAMSGNTEQSKEKKKKKRVSVCDRRTSFGECNAKHFHMLSSAKTFNIPEKFGRKLQQVFHSIFCWSHAKMAGIFIKTLSYPLY